MFPTLRQGDGFPRNSLSKRDAVLRLQKALGRAGIDVDKDGLFGLDTQRAVMSFQENFGLLVDGIVGVATWNKLTPFVRPGERNQSVSGNTNELEGFTGDLTWVHDREGHAGRPYWPGGQSGVTLDPGFDLAHQSEQRLRQYYSELSENQLNVLTSVLGIKGNDAKAVVKRSNISSIRTSKEMALAVMPSIASKYWRQLIKRFPGLINIPAPPCVKTVFLSLGYNRGAANKGLQVLEEPLQNSEWLKVAECVGQMQQDHQLRGIRIRRRLEAEYIRNELDFSVDVNPSTDPHIFFEQD